MVNYKPLLYIFADFEIFCQNVIHGHSFTTGVKMGLNAMARPHVNKTQHAIVDGVNRNNDKYIFQSTGSFYQLLKFGLNCDYSPSLGTTNRRKRNTTEQLS